MKNNVTKVLIGIALMFTAGVASSEPIEHTFSTNSVIIIDPLLTGRLTTVSGSFTYDNAVAPGGTIPDDAVFAGSTFYRALSNLSGNANGNSFSDSLGFVTVGDDKFFFISPPPRDVVNLTWSQAFGTNLSGFSIAGLTLESVSIFWIEGQPGIFLIF